MWILGEVESVPENWALTKKIFSKMAGEKKKTTNQNQNKQHGEKWKELIFGWLCNCVEYSCEEEEEEEDVQNPYSSMSA